VALDHELAAAVAQSDQDRAASSPASPVMHPARSSRRRHAITLVVVGAVLATLATAVGATFIGPRANTNDASPGQTGADGSPDLAGSLAGSSTGLGPLPGSGATGAVAIASGAESAALLAKRTDALIRYYEGRTETDRDATELRVLASLYLARGRVTGDAATYLRAQAAATRAQGLAPQDPEVIAILASTDATLHEFASARSLGESVLATHPTAFGARAIVGDAALETGDYAAASQSYAALAAALPNNSGVLVRQARLASIQGNLPLARTFAAKASAAALAEGAFGTALAFPRILQGKLAMDAGQYAQAERFYRQGLQAADSWHVALAGLARARAAQGDLVGATSWLQRAIDVVPLPEYLAALGDVLTARGDTRSAASAYATVDATASLTGSRLYDRQRVLFLADHAIAPDARTAQAVSLAQSELDARKDVFGYDALAWALLADGRANEALASVHSALALGTEDPLLHYHAGMVYAAVGDSPAAISELRRALTQSPHFDLLGARRATATLTSLSAKR